jgi:hypothetical protein
VSAQENNMPWRSIFFSSAIGPDRPKEDTQLMNPSPQALMHLPVCTGKFVPTSIINSNVHVFRDRACKFSVLFTKNSTPITFYNLSNWQLMMLFCINPG